MAVVAKGVHKIAEQVMGRRLKGTVERGRHSRGGGNVLWPKTHARVSSDKSDRDRARARADVHDNIVRLDASDAAPPSGLGFRGADQDIRRHAKSRP